MNEIYDLTGAIEGNEPVAHQQGLQRAPAPGMLPGNQELTEIQQGTFES